MSQQSPDKKTPALWKLILICSTASFFALLPANTIDTAGEYFGVSSSQASAILSWFLFGYGVGPLLYGPLANYFGRRKSLLIGFSFALVATLASVVAVISHNFNLLLITRTLAGIGTSAGLVVGMMMIADTASEAQSRKIFAMIVLFFSFAPSIAITSGNLMNHYFGFSTMFMAMAVILLVWLAISATLQETMPGKAVAFRLKHSIGQYKQLALQPSFIFPALLMTAASAVTYIFNGLSPLVATQQLHMSAIHYGNLAIIPAIGLFIGASSSSYLSKHLSANSCLQVGITLISIGAFALLGCYLTDNLYTWNLLLSALVMFAGVAIVIPNASMSAIANSSDTASASSLLNAQTLILSSFAVSAASSIMQQHTLSLPVALAGISVLSWVLLKLFNKNQLRKNKTHQATTLLPTNLTEEAII